MEDCLIDNIPLKDFFKKIGMKFDIHTFCLPEEADKKIAEVLKCPVGVCP
jgi:hypothetical protein